MTKNKIYLSDKDTAIYLASHARHISPEIVKYIVEKNKHEFTDFEKKYGNKIDVSNYLFEGSDCVFPGIRRSPDPELLKSKKRKYIHEYQAIIDDNEFPRHIWCYLTNGKPYSGPNWKETKLNDFELAHIFAFVTSKREVEKDFFNEFDNTILLYAQFTSAANGVLLPKGNTDSTDYNITIKSIFYKRHIDLYGEDTLRGQKGFIENKVPDWYPQLNWNDPFLPKNWKKNIDKLLDYRKKRITEIIDGKIKSNAKFNNNQERKSNNTTPELLFIPDRETFTNNLLITKRANRTIIYADGREKHNIWYAENFKDPKKLLHNISSGPLRKWEEKGIVKAIFEVEEL